MPVSCHLVSAVLKGSDGDGGWLLAYTSESANTLYFSFSMTNMAFLAISNSWSWI